MGEERGWVAGGVPSEGKEEESAPYCELGSRLGLAVETHSVASD